MQRYRAEKEVSEHAAMAWRRVYMHCPCGTHVRAWCSVDDSSRGVRDELAASLCAQCCLAMWPG